MIRNTSYCAPNSCSPVFGDFERPSARPDLWNERCTSRNTLETDNHLTYIYLFKTIFYLYIYIYIFVYAEVYTYDSLFLMTMPRAQSILPIDGSMKLSVLPMMELEVDLFCWGRLHCGKNPQMYEAKPPSQFPKADHERCLVESFYKALVLWDIEINVWSGCIFKLELSNGLTPAILCCIIYSWAIGTHGSHQLVSASHHRLLQCKPFESI